MADVPQSAEKGLLDGTAYGSDPAYHHIVDGEFVCSAPGDAKCRTFPTCECENWCCCDDEPTAHDPGEHCCMTTAKPGQGCWMAVWVDAVGVVDSNPEVTNDEHGAPILPDGPVSCDWDDGILWEYVTPSVETVQQEAPDAT